MDSNTDAELVLFARTGSRDAYGELIRRYQHQIWGLAYILLDDRFEAEDVTQEAFPRAWLNLDLLSDPAKFGPWVRRIVFGVSIDWLRAFRPDLYRLCDAVTELELSRQLAAGESALERLESIELRQRIWDAVARLPARYRLPLTLFHLDGLRHSKVAEALGVPVSTVRSLVTRARRKLQPMPASSAAEFLPALPPAIEDVLEEQTIGKSNMLHITDGESVAGALRESGIPGTVSIYGDLMYEGPAPAGLEAEAWRETRARFIAEAGYATPQGARQYLKTCDDALAAFSQYEEVIIWMDHRLSNQLTLIKVLDWFSRQELGGVELNVICAGSYPGMPDFVGLGQLTANQLASLADTRQRVTSAQFRLARAAWGAFTSPDPTVIESLIRTDTSALPFVVSALRRHLEQFPSLESGLSRTERQALSVLLEDGALSGRRLFSAVQHMEERIFMGDSSFCRLMADLSSAPHPLLQISQAAHLSLGEVAITEVGRNVVEGRADHIQLNGIDRWLGGVHLQSGKPICRWDRALARVVRHDA